MTDNDNNDQEIPDPGIDFDVEPTEINELAHSLSFAEHYDGDDLEEIAQYVSALKDIEKAAEDARKDVFEELLDEHVGVGESFGGLRRVSRSQRYVSNTTKLFEALRDRGIDPGLVVSSVKVGDVEDMLGVDAQEFFETREYDYYTKED